MGKKIIVVGDSTSHGGKVLSGSPTFDIRGKAVVRKGDKVSCPIHGDNTVAEGQENGLIVGTPVALEGHKTGCGSTLIGSVMAMHGR